MMERSAIIACLNGSDDEALFAEARRVRDETRGPQVYLRGLIEYSNICEKNCLYCGIRCAAGAVERYTLSDEQVLDAARYALQEDYGSVMIQAGERSGPLFVAQVEELIGKITQMSDGELGISLSLGEQSSETYRQWREAGATRYLLRIETSSPELYARLHPQDGQHSFECRLGALHDLRRAGFRVGTGVMIGLPGQSIENLADDLLFISELPADMCGMGPYIESPGTPLATEDNGFDRPERVALTLRMIALLRLLMPRINISATTALQTLTPDGLQRGIAAGANVLMPNITPAAERSSYKLYEGVPQGDIDLSGFDIAYGHWGDPPLGPVEP